MKDLCRNNFLSIVSIGITLMKSKQFAVKGVNFVIFQLYMVRYNSKYVIITKIVIIVKFCNYDLLTTLPETMLYPIFRYIRACTERVLLYYFHSVNHKMLECRLCPCCVELNVGVMYAKLSENDLMLRQNWDR